MSATLKTHEVNSAISLSRRRPKPLARIAFLIAFAIFCSRTQAQAASSPFSATITTLIIPKVDYEPAIYYKTGDPYPHLDFAKVDPRRVIQRSRPVIGGTLLALLPAEQASPARAPIGEPRFAER